MDGYINGEQTRWNYKGALSDYVTLKGAKGSRNSEKGSSFERD